MSDAVIVHLEIERAEDLARRLAAAVSARRIYAPRHTRAQTALQEFVADLRRALGTVHERVRFTVTGGLRTQPGGPVTGGTPGATLAQLLQERDCGGVVFRQGIGDEPIGQLVDWLAGRRAAGLRPAGEGLELLDPGAGEEL